MPLANLARSRNISSSVMTELIGSRRKLAGRNFPVRKIKNLPGEKNDVA